MQTYVQHAQITRSFARSPQWLLCSTLMLILTVIVSSGQLGQEASEVKSNMSFLKRELAKGESENPDDKFNEVMLVRLSLLDITGSV